MNTIISQFQALPVEAQVQLIAYVVGFISAAFGLLAWCEWERSK